MKLIDNLDKLKNYLSEQYEIVFFSDLATVCNSPGDIYSLLKHHYRPSFLQNQRLVFYTNQRVPIDLLTHIKEACLHIDISPSFILLCTNSDIYADINIVFGKEDFPSNLIVDVDAEILNNRYYYPKTICPLPWMHIATMYQGQILPCCVSNEVIGNIRDITLIDAFNSPTMQLLRQNFLDGKQPEGCNHCWEVESHAGKSSRQFLLEKYKTEFLSNWLSDHRLRSVDLKAGNTCNFKCRICTPVASSLVANEKLSMLSDRTEISKLRHAISQGRWFDDNSIGILNNIVDLAPDLVSIDFYGGEPFLLKSLNCLLERLIETGYSKQIKVHFNSNGSIYPEHLISNLAQFNSVSFCLSIDDIGPRFEYQRGGRWADIEDNLSKYQTLDPTRFSLSIYPIINIQNVYYFDELVNWAESKNILIIAEYLSSPPWMSISNLTIAAKQLILKKFCDHPNHIIQSIVNKIQSANNSDGEKFCKEMEILDLHRGQNFSDHHKEIAIAMGYSI